MMNVGVSYALQKGVGTSKSALQQKVKEQDKKIADMERTIRDMANKLQGLSLITDKKASFPDVPSDHWANNAVETLHGNDMVQGYPDGMFKGERPMTRYEYAEMLYNALTHGASVDQNHLLEYSKELEQVKQAKAGANRTSMAPAVRKPASAKRVPIVSSASSDASVKADMDMQALGQAYNASH